MAKKLTAAERRYLREGGDPALAKLRKAYRQQVVAQITRLAEQQGSAARALDRKLASALIYKRDGTLTAASKRRVDRLIDEMTDRTLDQFSRRFKITIDKGTRVTAEATAAYLKRKGFSVGTAEVKSIAREVAKADPRTFGATTKQRVVRIGKKHTARAETLLEAAPDNATFRARLMAGAAAPMGGPATRGGSMLKELTRVLVVDAFNKAAEVDTLVMRGAGVDFAYRRLSEEHRTSLDGAEECELLNVAVYPGIRRLLRESGIDPEGVDLLGLYPIDDRPGIPHPLCKCYWEPLLA